jgi:prefoldin subunit 5
MYQLTKEQKIENLQEVKKNLDSKIQNLNKQIADIEKKIQKLQTTKSFI